MDQSGVFKYGILSEGGCFGDISILNGKPNEFSYYYDNYTDIPLQCLTIQAEDFF